MQVLNSQELSIVSGGLPQPTYADWLFGRHNLVEMGWAGSGHWMLVN